MGYYSKRYITVVTGGQDKLNELKDIISKNNEYDWDNIVRLVDVGVLSDCNNNLGDGTKWYNFENDITNASEKLDGITIYVIEISEDDRLAEYLVTDGYLHKSYIEDENIGYRSDISQVSEFIDQRIKQIYND